MGECIYGPCDIPVNWYAVFNSKIKSVWPALLLTDSKSVNILKSENCESLWL